MRTQPVISWVTIIGTALSIFLIMTVVMMQQVNILSFAPESHRDRMLYGIYFHKTDDGGNGGSTSLSYETAKRLYGRLEGIELTCYQSSDIEKLDARGITREQFTVDVRQTDDEFWRVYDYDLLEGRYFDSADVAAERCVAVISNTVARRLFGGENAVGQHFELDHNDFEVVGIVADSSPLASMAYGQVFKPIDIQTTEDWGKEFGSLMASLLVKEGVDFESIREQVRGRYAQLDTELEASGQKTVYHGAPFDQEIIANGVGGSNVTPDASGPRTLRILTYIILLIVPAINLSSMLHSRLSRRVSEIGIRRAFGCTRSRIISDIISENLIVTVAGGIIGLALGIVFALFYDGLYSTEARPALSLLLDWHILAFAFSACFILNIISAAMPAWQAGRLNPVEAINAK